MECFKLLTEFACHVVHSFTKGVFETDRPQASQFICDTSGSYSPMSNAESEWVRYTFDDTFIYQEYSNFPNRDCCGREAIASAKLEFPIAAHDLFTDEDSEDPMGWKMQRPPFTETLKRVLIWGSVVSLLVASCVGLLCALYSYVSLQTSDRCWSLKWKDIPYKVQWYIQTCVYVKISMNYFLNFVSILLVFKRSQIEGIRLKLFLVTGVFTLLDISYKAVLQMMGNLRKSWLLWLPGNVLFFAAIVAKSRILSGRFRSDGPGKRTLAIQFALPWALSHCVKYMFVYGIFPSYKMSNESGKFLVAMFSPLCVVILKALSRLCLQRLWGITHPGTSFIFLAPLYCASALFTRMLQAELEDLTLIVTLAVIHGVVEVVERSTIAWRDHIHNQIFEKKFAPCGTFRSPRCERLNADIVILSMLQEAISIVAVNGFVFVLSMVYSLPENVPDLIKSWLIKTAVQLIIEWFFTSVSFAIETHFQNMPVMKVWKTKWCLHIIVSLILATTIFSASTGYFYVLLNIHSSGTDRLNQNCDLPFSTTH